MWKAPLVEEVRTAREQIARACDYDLKKILARLKQHEAEHPERLVRKGDLPKRKGRAVERGGIDAKINPVVTALWGSVAQEAGCWCRLLCL